jgi:hypothetical protein
VPAALAECRRRTGRCGAAAAALLGLGRFDTRTKDMGTHGRDPRARPLPAATNRARVRFRLPWVLGAWKIPTERADAILPRLRETTFRFGLPCAIVRDLGRAMTEAAETLVKDLELRIPVLACHLHFLGDVGKDLLEEGHDRLRVVFRQVNLRSQLRTLARDPGRNLGQDIDDARAGLHR